MLLIQLLQQWIFNVTPRPPTQFTVVPSTFSVQVGTAITITVTALDVTNAVDQFYNGTVALISGDASASLPGAYTYISGPSNDAGKHTFTNVILNTVEVLTITALDALNGITKSVTITVTPVTTAQTLSPEIIAGITVATIAVALLASLSAAFIFWKKMKSPKDELSLPSSKRISRIEKVKLSNIIIKKKLGAGSFGEVYYGLWNEIPVALKKLHNSEDYIAFEREGSLLAELSHPSIVQFRGFYTSPEGDDYIVTDFAQNGSLLYFLHNKGDTLDLKQLVDMLIRAAQGMYYLEQKQVIHRDLACRNLLVSNNLDVVIRYLKFYFLKIDLILKNSDFGLSRLENYYNSKGSTFPVKWTAVEIFKGRPFTSASDVWSFGIMCWEVLEKGTPPFNWLSNSEAIQKIQGQ